MSNKTLKLTFKILTAVFALLLAILLTGTAILMENRAAVSGFLGVKMQEIVADPDLAPDVDTEYYKSDYSSVAEEKANGEKLCEQVESEGAVLLENAYDEKTKTYALPISKEGAKVSLFSVSSIDLAIGGGGSGSSAGATKVDLKTAMEEVGFTVNTGLWDFYTQNKSVYGRTSNNSVGVEYTIGDAPWSALPAAKTEPADAAVFVLTRLGSESVDIRFNTGDKRDMTNGNYLELSPNEISVLENLKENTGEGKPFGKLIVVMNTTNQVECDFIEKYNVDALLWAGIVGSTGSRAIAKILRGTVNPSGKLSDAFWREHRFNPVYANWGVFFYDVPGGGDSSKITQCDIGGSCSPYVVYQEGIYNGYLYTETRYEDKMLQRENADGNGYTFDYYEAVAYPFGYGLSYTQFEYSAFESLGYNEETDEYGFSVKVKNTGKVAGKETVQLYLQKPYTDYDIEHGVEKAAVELAGFAKTSLLEPDASEVVKIFVDGKYLASYDSYNAETYIVDAGTYYFTVGRDAHDAVNNIIKKKKADAVTSSKGTTGAGNPAFVWETEKTFDKEKYSVSVTGKEITNRFDNADLKLYSPENKDAITYITRNDWAGTAKFGFDENMNSLHNEVELVWTDAISDDMRDLITVPPESDREYPTYGSTETAFSLIDMRETADGEKIAYDDELWDKLLDQLTWEETVSLLSCGVRMTQGIPSVNKPLTIDHNGGVGVNQRYNINSNTNRGLAESTGDPQRSTYPSAYPCNQIVASTYNIELIEEYGRAWGEDCLWAGYSGLYGPGLNSHRGAYGGRTFEYYSEDAFLGGSIAAALCRGLVEKGVYVYLKHAVLNEQEENRLYVATWANEQTIRELYLRQFELAIVEGGAQCVMTGYNKIGSVWTGKQGFVNSVLHDEFGMSGFAVTDFVLDPHYKRMQMAVLQGNGLVDRDFSMYPVFEDCKPGTKHGDVAWAMREELHRILYTVVHSNAMNGISSGTRIIIYTPSWTFLVKGLDIGAGCILGACLLILISCYVAELFKKRKQTAVNEHCAASDEKTKKPQENVSGGIDEGAVKKASRGKLGLMSIMRICIAGVLVVALLIDGLVTGGLMVKNTANNQNAANSVRKIADETKGGEGVIDHIFEAEAAELVGRTGMWQYYTHACPSMSYRIGAGISGGIAVQNIFSPQVEGEEPNKLSFEFTSDKTVKVNMAITVSRADSGNFGKRNLGDFYTITVNGKKAANDVDIPNTGGNEAGFVEVTVPVTLVEGKNEIIFTTKPKVTSLEGEIDCINIKTSAALTDFTPHYLDMSLFEIKTYPMAQRAGKLLAVCPVCQGATEYELPDLTEGVEKDFYTVKQAEKAGETVNEYYLGKTDLLVCLDPLPKTVRHTLTVADERVAFENGTNSTEVWENYPLPQATESREGFHIIGWYDVNDAQSRWTAKSFSMPTKNITINPIWEVDEYCANAADGGKIDLNPKDNELSYIPIHSNGCVGFDIALLKKGVTDGAIVTGEGDEIYGEGATVYSYAGGVKTDWSFISCVPCNVNGKAEMLFTVENQGKEKLVFEMWQTNTSGNPTSAGNENKTLELDPGRQRIFKLSPSLVNGNVLTYYRFLQNSGDFKLAVMQYIGPVGTLPNPPMYPGEEKHLTIANVVGSEYKVTYNGGETIDLFEGYALPQLQVDAPNGYELAGFFNADNQSETFTVQSFIMPDRDIRLTPYFKSTRFEASADEGCQVDLMATGDSGGLIHPNSINGFNKGVLERSMKEGIVFTGEGSKAFYDGSATVYGYAGGVSAGWSYIAFVPCRTSSGTTYEFRFTFRNLGTEEISFEIWQTNSSGNPKNAANAHDTVTLAAGASAEITLTPNNLGNNNIMTYFEFLNTTTTDMSLAVSLYVVKA